MDSLVRFQSRTEAAEALHDQKKALDGVGTAAKNAGKQLAAFDDVNQMSSSNDETGAGTGGIDPAFSLLGGSWIEEMLDRVPDWVATALLLGGIALIAIGAATGSLSLILAGLLMLGAGVYITLRNGSLPG